MANIKVTFGSIVRRLSISSTTTWSELENQFRNLFSIPQEIPIAVTYVDEDGDVITLSSDLELQEVLANPSNNANTIKFALNIPNVNNLNNREISIDTVIDEEETSNLINGLSAIQIKESNNDNNNNNNDNVISGFKHVTITDEVDDPLFNQQRETPGENSKNSTKSSSNVQENNNSEGNGNQENSDDDEHEIIVIITRNPWSHRRRARFGGRNPYYYPCVGRFRYGCHPHPHPHPEQGHGGQGGQGHNHGHNHGGYNRSGYFRGHGCGRYFRRHHHHQQMSPEDVIEKVNTLNSMGFVEGDLEGLVKRYNGNLEFVIESLLFNKQNEQNSEVSNEDVVRKENDEKDQPMEVEEESGPYVL